MGRKARPNEPCPCGSGTKFKRCCGGSAAVAKSAGPPYTATDRASALQKLSFFVDELWEEEEELAFDELWGRFLDHEDELPPDMLDMSNGVQDAWFAFDYQLDDDTRVIDHFLEQAELTAGERAYLTAMKRSTMRFYEVTDTVPGTSMTLRDLHEGTVVIVNERSASRQIVRHSCLAARVIPRGHTGGPEMDLGVLPIVTPVRDSVIEALKERQREERTMSVGELFKEMPPLFHQAWLASIFEPAIPELRNTDGEPMVLTRVSWRVDDADSVVLALDAANEQGIETSRDRSWGWFGPNQKGQPTSLGTISLSDDLLTMEANSVERGARGRALLEALAGSHMRHRATTHEDVERRVREAVTAQALGQEGPAREPAPSQLEPDVAEALVAAHYARHYRAWIDEAVPALGGKTPREARAIPALRAQLEDLIHQLDGMYERALKDGQPAYDPSWMWDELELRDPAEALRLPLAHERVAERVPGSVEIARAAAERLRRIAGDEAVTMIVDDAAFCADLDLQRFLRVERGAANETGAEGAAAAPYLRHMVNFELHRRKTFWVDAALSYMLDHTDVDVAGGELRVPFPSFCLALTDRHTLCLGERLLARQKSDPLRGQILRVVTVYVTEERHGESRRLEITFAFDALGADLPSLARYELSLVGDASVRAFLASVAPPPPVADPPIPDVHPARRLLRIALNAILYATSSGVTPEIRTVPPRARANVADPTSSESVYYLPGSIDIRSVRRLQEIERAPEGNTTLARFMVRGHWRRPNKTWTDQRLRWIEPYWKGPELAAVIERIYRLKP